MRRSNTGRMICAAASSSCADTARSRCLAVKCAVAARCDDNGEPLAAAAVTAAAAAAAAAAEAGAEDVPQSAEPERGVAECEFPRDPLPPPLAPPKAPGDLGSDATAPAAVAAAAEAAAAEAADSAMYFL